MAIREGAWDCPSCGRKKNRGPDKFCGGCGAPRGPEVKFYLPDDAPEVVEAEALKKAQAGPDWICPYCESDNPAGNSFCSGCGAPKDGAQAREVVEHRNDAPPPPPPPQPLGAQPPPPAGKKWTGPVMKGCGLGCLGLLALFALLLFLGRPKDAVLTVTGLRWERSIEVEQARTVTKQAWEGELPAGARVLSTSREIHHHDRVQTGTRTATRTVTEQVQTGTERVKVGSRDLGNGYFEDVYEDRPVYESQSHEETYEEPVYREDPVYRNRFRYEIEEWGTVRTAQAKGEDRSPGWPDPGIGDREREGKRTEVYEVLFADEDGKSWIYKAPNEAEWSTFEPGRTYKATVQGDKVVSVEGAEE
ncbi:MAG TPA: zinc ribbon domain-containing protein [Thermoanaerobaculia bacterium]|nr:zinc ribbon domain-containing protein [Thermoanaerobaculia bacterium]